MLEWLCAQSCAVHLLLHAWHTWLMVVRRSSLWGVVLIPIGQGYCGGGGCGNEYEVVLP